MEQGGNKGLLLAPRLLRRGLVLRCHYTVTAEFRDSEYRTKPEPDYGDCWWLPMHPYLLMAS